MRRAWKCQSNRKFLTGRSIGLLVSVVLLMGALTAQVEAAALAQREVLPSGMVLLVAERPGVPIVAATLTLQAGALKQVTAPMTFLVAASIAQSAVLFAVAVLLGLRAADAVGLTTPLTDAIAARMQGVLLRFLETGERLIELTFQSGASRFTAIADRVVLAIPFSVLRKLDYASAGFSPTKRTFLT